MKLCWKLSLYSLSTVVASLVLIQCTFICVVVFFTKPSLFYFGSRTEHRAAKTDSSDTLSWYNNENAYLHNTSFCNFKFGQREKFDLSNATISNSVELGSQSPYNVIYNVIESNYKPRPEEEEGVTYCTHATPTYIHHIMELARRWNGPISVALFVPGYDAVLSLIIIDQLCLCFPEMEKVSFHFVYPALHPPDFSTFYLRNESILDFNSECALPIPLLKQTLKTYRSGNELIYPVNVHRNAARQAALTNYVLVSDIELVPSVRFVPSFKKMIKKYTWIGPHVFVLPVFEVEKSVKKIPKNKKELQQLYFENKAFYFHRWVCLHCQLFPGLVRWIHEEVTPDLQPRSVIRRHFPYHRWEPIFVGTHREPLYDELLSWEGQQDKMIQLHTMCLLDYQFIILNNAFLVHVPGVKRRGTEESPKRRQHIISNQRLYSLIGRRLEKKHQHIPRRACRLS